MTRAFIHFSRFAVLAALACTVTLALGGTAAASSRSREAGAGPITVAILLRNTMVALSRQRALYEATYGTADRLAAE